jgi:hypothetical protein
LSENLPGGLIYTYGLYLGDNQVGFQCFANYTPPKKGQPVILHSNRTVIHPDYVGIGLGIKIIDETSKLMRLHPEGYRIMGKFSNEAIYQSMRKNPLWVLKNVARFTAKAGDGMERKSGLRQAVKTYSFEFIG